MAEVGDRTRRTSEGQVGSDPCPSYPAIAGERRVFEKGRSVVGRADPGTQSGNLHALEAALGYVNPEKWPQESGK
jgi:hypothetical protein